MLNLVFCLIQSMKFSEQLKAGYVSGSVLGVKDIIVDKKGSIFVLTGSEMSF